MLVSKLTAGATARDGLQVLASPKLRLWWVALEVVVVTLLVIALGRWSSPADPLFTASQIPWTWFAPVLIALRYGVLAGCVSMLIVLLAWRVMLGDASAPFPTLYFVGGLLLTMVCGEFSGLWRTRIRRLSQANAYLEDRIERVTKRLFMVQRSHDVLEQDLLLQPSTLRQALGDMRARSLAGQLDAKAAAQAFLDFLGVHCQIESAQVLALGPQGGANGDVLAHVGQQVPVSPSDPLVTYALTNRRLAHVQSGQPAHEARTEHLVAAPLVLGPRREQALLVVSRMPFLALHDEALELMAVLCSSFSDAALVSEAVPALLRQLPQCPIEFAEEANRLDRIAREFKIPSQVVVVTFEDPERAATQRRLAERRARTPDVIWPYSLSGGRERLVTLMPLVGRTAVDGYLNSLANFLAQRQGMGVERGELAAMRIRVRVLPLGQAPLGEALQGVLGGTS